MTELLDCRITQRTFIAAPPGNVFETITSARHWDNFFTTGMELEPRPGGVCSFSWKDWGPDRYTMKVPGEVVEFRPPEVFAFRWGRPGRETSVRMELAAADGGTVVTLTEDGYRNNPEDRAMIVECAAGWGEALTLLKFYIEHGITYEKK